MWMESLVISFLAAAAAGPLILRTVNRRKVLMVRDMHKPGNTMVSTTGGVIMIAGFTAAILYNIAFGSDTVAMLAALSSIILVTLLGLLDDIINLPQIWRAILPVFASAPLAAIRAGVTTMHFPFLGEINFGKWYRLLVIPAGVTGASNAVNMVAGLNGLETGMGAVMTGALLLISLKIGAGSAAVLSACVLGTLIAFLAFNFTPAKILPGNSGSYFIGCALATICILGNMEKAGIIIMGPYFIELLLKARTWFKAESFGKLRKDGTLEADRVDSLTHLVMRSGRFTEAQIVSILMLIEAVFCGLAYWSMGR